MRWPSRVTPMQRSSGSVAALSLFCHAAVVAEQSAASGELLTFEDAEARLTAGKIVAIGSAAPESSELEMERGRTVSSGCAS